MQYSSSGKNSKTKEIQNIPVEALLLDYDGTISPLRVPRNESRVPPKTQAVLREIGQRIPIAVVTSKAADFIVPRTPFASSWSTNNGLDTLIADNVSETFIPKQLVATLQLGLEYARCQLDDFDVEIEEKKNWSRRVVGFCVDWRRSKNFAAAKKAAIHLAGRFREMQLYVASFPGDPYYDVYPVPTHKGRAVEAIRKQLGLKTGVMFLGDSELDNPAFLLSDLSLGVLNKGSRSRLCCDYYLRFEGVADFLEELWENDLIFDPDFSTVRCHAE